MQERSDEVSCYLPFIIPIVVIVFKLIIIFRQAVCGDGDGRFLQLLMNIGFLGFLVVVVLVFCGR